MEEIKDLNLKESSDIQGQGILEESRDDRAGFNERFIAYLIDTLPFVLAAYYSFAILTKNGTLTYSSALEVKWKLLWSILFIIYETVFTSGGRATLGKYILGIRVISTNGEGLSLVKAFLRAVGYFISSVIINLGYLMALLPSKRALHDYMAGSKVIRVKEKTAFTEGFILVLSWSLMAFFIASWINRTVLKFSPFEQKQIMQAKRTLAKLAKLEEIYFQKYNYYTNDIRKLAELTGNVGAVRKELAKNLDENSIEIASNGKNYIITARAKNWRKTKIEISNLSSNQ